MLKAKERKEAIEKIAAVSKFLEIILRTESNMRFSILERGSRIRLRVIPGKQHFPETLFGIAVRELADEIDRFFEYSVKYRKPKLGKLVTLEGLE